MSAVTFPESWNRSRIKHVSSLKGRLGWQGLKAEEYRDEGPFVVSSAHFRNDRIVWDMCPHVSWERYRLDANIQLAQLDVLLMKDGAALGKLAFLEHLPGPACLNSHLLLLRPLREAYWPKFLYYYMRTAFFQEYILIRGTGATFLGVSQETIGNHELTLPPANEQRAIVGFLDRKTAAIDALIAKKERLIELLQEKRQALITQAVTKGLDPSVPMKDSGVAWLGRVPEHWSVSSLKYVATFQRGHDLPADKRSDGPFPIVSSGGIIGTHREGAARGPGIVTGRYGSIGKFDLVGCDYWPLNTALYTKNLWANAPRFVFYALSYLAPLFVMESKKSAVPGVDRNDLHVYSLAVPPPPEQERIASHLDDVVQRMDRLAGANAVSVEKLREYRQALITAAVTGKIDLSTEAA